MHAISYRRCGPDDAAVLALVGQATFLETFAGTLPGSDILAHCAKQHGIEKYRAYLADSSTAVWLAEVAPDGAPVGYVLVTKPDLPLADLSSADAEVKRVYLLGRFRGHGVGRRLMDLARDHAIAQGKRRLLLGVYSGNTAAIGFYEKLGYQRIGTRDFQVGANRYHDFLFGLSL